MRSTLAEARPPEKAMAAAPLAVIGLEKRYAGFVLGPVTFSVPEGMVAGLVGRNGAGKTTIMRSVLGLTKPDGGTISLFGQDISALSAEEALPLRQRIASVSAICPYPEVYAAGDIARIYEGLYPRFDRSYLRELLERMAAGHGTGADVAASPIKSLSRGQGMKLQIALALATHAELLVLDEPTAGLDPIVRQETLDILRAHLAAFPETSILVSSHITTDLEGLADRIILIEEGRICLAQDADVLEERYASLLVHGFVFEEQRRAFREAGATKFIEEGGHVQLLIEDAPRFARTFPDMAAEPISLDALMRLAVKGADL